MGKKLRDEDLVLNIIVNGDKGKKEIGALERAIKDTTAELSALESQEKNLRLSGKKNTEQYKAVTAAIKQKNDALVLSEARLKSLKQGLDLNSMSLRDLRSEMNRISRLRNIADPGSKNWQKHDAQLKIVSDRYRHVRAQSELTGNSIQSMSSKATRAIGAIAASVTTVIAAFSGIRKATDMFAAFDDQVAEVMKTTGLLKEEVLEIDQNLRNFDTRSSQEELLGLGRVAGKLGIDMQEDVEGFIRAADQIGVALSEDLGGDVEKAINDVGKLVDIFGQTEEFGIEQALLKTGSAINELGASSTANEAYLVDFTKRLGGVAPAANIAISDILGLGATLDQFGQSVETSGTAMSQLIVNMFDDTANYAKIAGMEVSDFTKLLETDANEALITLLEAVKGNDSSMTALVGRLKELGIDGARATQVVSVLSTNTETLREQQILANQAFEEGNSISDEFAIKNETAAAKLEKARNQVNLLWVDLGQKLFPVITAGNQIFSTFLSTIITLIGFIQENWKIISALTAAIVTYNAALFITNTYTKIAIVQSKLKVFWDNAMRASTLLAAAAQALFAGNITRATAAMKIFNSVSKVNPWVALASVIIGAGVAIYQFSKQLTSAEKAQRKLNDVQLQAEKAIVREKIEMEQLLAVARDKTKSDEERLKAIEALQKLSPKYLSNLSLETINTKESKAATDAYIESLLKKASVQAAEDELVELQKKRLEAMKTGQAEELSLWQKTKLAVLAAANDQSLVNDVREQYRKENREAMEADFQAQEELLTGFIQKNRDLNEKLKPVTEEDDTTTTTTTITTNGGSKPKTNSKSSLEKQLQQQAEYRQKIIDGQKSLVEQEKLAYEERLRQAGIYGKDVTELTAEENTVREALQEQYYNNINQLDAEAVEGFIQNNQSRFERELQQLRTLNNEKYKEIKTLEDAKALLQDDLSQEALDGLKNLRQAQKEVDKKFIRDEEQMVKEHLQGLMAQLNSLMAGGEVEGLDLADKLLSDEERQVLADRIADVKEQLSELGLKSGTEIAEDEGLRNSGVDVLGFSAEDWDAFYTRLEGGKTRMDDIAQAANALGQIWTQYNEFKAASERKELQEYKQVNDQKQAALKKRLDQGVISQDEYNEQIDELNLQLDKKTAVHERNQAKRERNVALMAAIVNTAQAVTSALTAGPVMGPILAGIIGGMGLLQIAKIRNEPLPEIPGAEEGGYLDVVRAQDKKMFRSRGFISSGFVDKPKVLVGENGTEFVANNEAYQNPTIRPVLDAIDTAQRNGTISSINLEKVMARRMELFTLPGRQQGGYSRPKNPAPTPAPQPDPEVMDLIKRNNDLMNSLNKQISKGIRADVSLLGKRGFYEAEKDYDEIIQNTDL
ncbi:phage tail tape measure protein [Cyclobacterium sediminis]